MSNQGLTHLHQTQTPARARGWSVASAVFRQLLEVLQAKESVRSQRRGQELNETPGLSGSTGKRKETEQKDSVFLYPAAFYFVPFQTLLLGFEFLPWPLDYKRENSNEVLPVSCRLSDK